MKLDLNVSQLIDEFDYSGYETPAGQLKILQEESTDELLKETIQIEIDSLNFFLHKGKLKSIFSTTDKSGLVIKEYPSLKDFNDASLNYLNERLKETHNPRIKIRYGQILSNANAKSKGEIIKATVDNYLIVVNKGMGMKGRNHFYSDLSNLLNLAISSKYKIDKVTKMILGLILQDKTPYDNFLILIPEVLSSSKYFDNKDFKRILDKGDLIWNDKTGEGTLTSQMIADRCIELANKLKEIAKSKIWYERLGKVFEDAIDVRVKDDPTGMMPIEFCERAIRNYRKANRKDKIDELLKRLTVLKANLKLDTFNFTFDSKDILELYKYHQKVAKNLVTKDTKFIYNFLASGVNVFPDLDFLKKSIKARGKSFEDFVQVIAYDINKNPRRGKKGSLSTEEVDIDLMKDYDWYVQIVTNQFLREVFIHGLYRGKINFRTMIDHLYNHSWIGKNIAYKDSGGLPFDHNWLALIAPALMEFLVHWQSLIFSNNKFSNFVLGIDSLTLKFEGILRDFARMIGAKTLVDAKGGIREAYVEELLTDVEIKKYFDENDLMLFKYLFTSSGMNMRNNVAHSFYKFADYRPEKMILVIVAILKIARYQVQIDKIVL